MSSFRHCKHTGRVCRYTISMSMPIDTRSAPSGPLGLLGKRGESAAMGQVAMATHHGGRRTTRTGGAGYPIGERPSPPLGEDAKGAPAGCLLHRAPQVVGEVKEGGANGAELHCQTAAQSTASCNTDIHTFYTLTRYWRGQWASIPVL